MYGLEPAIWGGFGVLDLGLEGVMGAVVVVVEIGTPVPIFARSGRRASSSRRR